MTITVAYQQATTYPAATDRRLLQGSVMQSSRTANRPGIVPQVDDNSLKVSLASVMTLNVQGGVAICPDDYRVYSDAVTQVVIEPGGASARTDLVCLRVYDLESGDLASNAAIEVVKGVTTAVPATPLRAISLATVAVAAGAATLTAGNITDTRTYSTNAGGVLRYPNVPASAAGLNIPSGTILFDPVLNKYFVVRNSNVIAPLGLMAQPYLWVGNLGSVTVNGVLKFSSVITDNTGGWDAANGRYTIPTTGLYMISTKTLTNGSGGFSCPVVQTAATAGGTYTHRLSSSVLGNNAYNGGYVVGMLQLSANNGLRVMEINSAWTGDNGTQIGMNNYLQLTYLGSSV